MSLSVKLFKEKWVSYDEGKTRTKETEYVYDANITHNLNEMAGEAGIYKALWRPYRLREDFKDLGLYACDEDEYEKKCLIRAEDIIELLEIGLIDLKERPEHFEQFNSSNGWGMYEHFVPFVEKYLNACKKYPKCLIEIDR
tara:strand:- start:5040 stop:5462 length:423 start_codon:yes stop_codon:yes gene_type:complete